jgi:hypothetical protein
MAADPEVIVEQEPAEPEVTVEVAADTEKPGKPQLSDVEVEKLAELPAEDEIGRYAKDAQKRIKSLHVVTQEWRRRVIQSAKDVATATTLAEQLYRENQELKANMGRSEAALIEQAIQRVEAQLAQARLAARAAIASQDPDQMIAANEQVSRFVAEADRLRILRQPTPAAGEAPPPAAAPLSPPPAAPPPSAGVQDWLKRNTWFGKPGEEETTNFAMGVHHSLERQGITEASDPEKYWSTIDRRLREVYPDRFGKPAAEGAHPQSRPVAVTGSTRTNGQAAAERPTNKRHIVLSESQVRIARALGLTPEQYATQLVKDEAKERVQ